MIAHQLQTAAGAGNVSLLEGDLFINAHMTLSDGQRHTYGGHLNSGTEIFVCEAAILELNGEPPERVFDTACRPPLWGGTP